jgi:flagellar M-ring protein FliF
VRDSIRPLDVWRSLEPRGQLALAGSAVLVLAAVVFLFQFASKPSYTTITTGLSAAEATKAGKALEEAGIDFRFEGSGTQVAVREGQEAQARVAMGGAGLSGSGHVGFELFDKKSLGATDFQQRVDYQRALEGEIARTIEQIDGVGGAQVQLVLPEESLFLDDAPKASAAVLLAGTGGLDAAAVRGIAHLVASSVKGLSSDLVTITDESGALLWPSGAAGSAAGVAQKLAAETQYATQLSSQLNAMLAQTLGPGKALARVHASLNVDEVTVDKVAYAKKGTPLAATKEQESLATEGTTAGGPAGTTANVPTYAGSASGSGTSNYRNTKTTTEFGVDKTVSRTNVLPGRVEKLDIALMLDEAAVTDKETKAVDSELVEQLESAVRSASGFDENREDTLSVSIVEFAEQPEAKAAPSGPVAGIMENPMAVLKPIGIGIAAIVFLFLMRKGLKRREGEGVAAEPTWLREIERAMPIGELGPGPQVDADTARRQALQQQVEDAVRQQPDAVAAQVSQWVRE